MFNITVLKGRDILRFLVGLILLIFIIILISKRLNKENNKMVAEVKSEITSVSEKNMKSAIDQVLPNIGDNNQTENISRKSNILEDILKVQVASIGEVNKEQQKEENNNAISKEINEEKQEQTSDTQKAQTGLTTEVTTKNPIAENSNRQYGSVKIKNQTTYELTDEVLNPNISIENKNIIIFHTHSCESYTPSDAYSYTPTGTFRTTDSNFSVVRVGTELENQLKQYNYNVIHNTSYHDYPSYNGSYTRSLATVEGILKDNPSDIIIDIHRDAVGSRSDYAPTVKIGDEDVAAQIMFVIGTNEGGLGHPNWQQNLKFAVKVQQKAEEMYPGLFKPIMVTKSRYNQHTGKFANIIEVGATGNKLEECLTSMKYLAKVMDEVLK